MFKMQTISYYKVSNCRVNKFIKQDNILQTLDKVLSNGPGFYITVL